jgi:hypothetical protein
MEAHAVRSILIKEIRGNGLLNILAQLLPGVALREDVVCQTFCNESSVSFLCNAKDYFHGLKLSRLARNNKPSSASASGSRARCV